MENGDEDIFYHFHFISKSINSAYIEDKEVNWKQKESILSIHQYVTLQTQWTGM